MGRKAWEIGVGMRVSERGFVIRGLLAGIAMNYVCTESVVNAETISGVAARRGKGRGWFVPDSRCGAWRVVLVPLGRKAGCVYAPAG